MSSLFMLAKAVKSLDNIDWRFVRLEPKIDGIRMGYTEKAGAFSRTGKDISNIDHILDEIRQLKLGSQVMLDGELSGRSWNETMSLAMSDVTKKPNTILKYTVFDMFCNKYESMHFDKRRQMLESVVGRGFKYIKLIPSIPGEGYSHAKRVFIACQKAGYEGIMIKDVNSPYVFKRSSFWLKYKSKHFTDAPTLETMDCKIINFDEGKGKYEGTLGALVVKQSNGNICRVSGMTDKQRNIFWNNQDKIIGMYVEVSYQELSNDGNMRFPIFKRLRRDK